MAPWRDSFVTWKSYLMWCSSLKKPKFSPNVEIRAFADQSLWTQMSSKEEGGQESEKEIMTLVLN